MAQTRRPTMREIHSLDDIPTFASEAEEAEFWATHGLGEEILAQMGRLPDDLLPTRPRTRPIAVRFDADVLQRLRALAARKRKGYQTLLKEFVLERLYEEEKREGLLGSKGL